MENNLMNEQNIFKFIYSGLNLEFELFTKSFILEKMKDLEKNKIILPTKCIVIPKSRRPFAELQNYYKNELKCKRYYFAYIKFFECNGTEYGLVGGKTNYIYPDINFDYDMDTIGRNFLKANKYDWCREVVIVNYNDENITDKKVEDKKARFLECFLQRQFNLFDS